MLLGRVVAGERGISVVLSCAGMDVVESAFEPVAMVAFALEV